MRSWPLGAVRMTERFLARERVKPKHLKALREHVGATRSARSPWLNADGGDARRHRRHGPQPRRRGRAARGAAVVRRPGLPAAHARRSTSWSSASPSMTPRRARQGARHQARARRPDPGRRAGRADGDGGRRLRRARGHRGRPARGRVLRHAARATATRRCSTTCARASVRNLAAQYDAGPRAHRARRAARARDVGRARRSGDPRRARAAVGRGDAARHRHVDRLRRPPQALALPDPQRRPAGLLPARDRADRPDGPLPPQGQARARASSRARRATATRSCWTRCAAVLRVAEQLERSRDQAVDRVSVDVDERPRRACTLRGARGRHGRAAGPRERQARRVQAGVRARARGQRGPERRRDDGADGDELALGHRLDDLLLGLFACRRRARRRR